MSFYLDMKSTMAAFGTKLTVYPYVEGKWSEGQWQDGLLGDAVEVVEPFVPMGRISQYSAMLATRESGVVERYEAEWLSSGDYPLGTVVQHGERRLVVRDKDDYTDYSNVTIYYLEAESDDQNENGDE